MKKISKGTQVLIRANVVDRCQDSRPEDERGYIVRTSRGEVRVEPCDMYMLLKKEQ